MREFLERAAIAEPRLLFEREWRICATCFCIILYFVDRAVHLGTLRVNSQIDALF
jgi:hypothetical protein